MTVPRSILPTGQRARLLEVQGVHKTFNGAGMALRRITLTVTEGDFILLLGPSGCGKSTPLRFIAGRILWSGGQGTCDLGAVFQQPTRLRGQIGCTVICVTHPVFESVFLSDRVIVMAARPGRVIAKVTVNAPCLRDLAFRSVADDAAHCTVASAARADAMGKAG